MLADFRMAVVLMARKSSSTGPGDDPCGRRCSPRALSQGLERAMIRSSRNASLHACPVAFSQRCRSIETLRSRCCASPISERFSPEGAEENREGGEGRSPAVRSKVRTAVHCAGKCSSPGTEAGSRSAAVARSQRKRSRSWRGPRRRPRPRPRACQPSEPTRVQICPTRSG